MIILHNSHKRHHNSPRYHDCWQPNAGPQPLQKKITWHFERGVCEEEHRETPVIPGRQQLAIALFHATKVTMLTADLSYADLQPVPQFSRSRYCLDPKMIVDIVEQA